jgi:hypothetical protein
MYTRFKNENKAINLSQTDLPVRQVYSRPKESWRTHISYSISPRLTFNQRVEVLWFDPHEKDRNQQGFLVYVDSRYKLSHTPVALNARVQYFETDGFDSRLYSFESDVLFSYSIPQFIGKGVRYYINFNCKVSRKLTIWCRWAETVYSNQNSISSGLDKIEGNKRSEIKFQALYTF